MKCQVLAVTLAGCVWAAPAAAQHTPHPEVVTAVKSDLQARGVDLSGSCGAFAITKRVAWALKAEGVGLLSKPSGNNCEGYAVDFLTYQDGVGVDILGDGGGANTPGWAADFDAALLGRWREPVPPEGAQLPPPVSVPPTPTLPPVVVESPRLATIEQVVAEIRQSVLISNPAILAKLDLLSAQLKEHDENPSWLAKVFGNRYVQLALTAVAAYETTRMTKGADQ